MTFEINSELRNTSALLGMHNERKDHRKDHQQFQITTLGATASKSALYQPFLFDGHL